jgi:hypothetical protein
LIAMRTSIARAGESLTEGREASEKSRHGLNCPNSPYRDYVVSLTGEMCNDTCHNVRQQVNLDASNLAPRGGRGAP